MVQFSAVPDALVLDGEARRVFEDVLFGQICDSSDASLAWLLDRRHTLRWIDGAPPTVESYAVYSIRPEDVSRARDGDYESARHAKGVWINYLGFNHGRNAKGRVGQEPRELACDGTRVLLGTAHGVMLTDRARSRYAWIFVNQGGGEVKLRWPSIRGARIDGDVAIIDTIHGERRVDLRTGTLRPQ